MKSRTSMWMPVVYLLAALAIPVWLAAQDHHQQPPTYRVLHSFTGQDGANPQAPLILDKAGNLYGTTGTGGDLSCSQGSGYGCGVVFTLDRTGKETVLHSFSGGTDGAITQFSYAGVVRDPAGNLYGTTAAGGDLSCQLGYASGCGVVFKLDRNGNETVLHTFAGADGAVPEPSLLRDEAGNLYGTTSFGGDLSCSDDPGGGCGVVFKLDRSGKETVLYSFTSGADGAYPNAGLIRDEEGNLYGTTTGGGLSNQGTVFKLGRTGKETVLYSFTGGADGGFPLGDLIRDEKGSLYGTTSGGGLSNQGTVFKLDRTGKETVLYSFTGAADGGYPGAGLVRDEEGNLYGTTLFGGIGGFSGVVFKLDWTGKETVLYSFTGGADGSNPYAPLVRDSAGNFYGTTNSGGDTSCAVGQGYGCGVVFKLALSHGGDRETSQ